MKIYFRLLAIVGLFLSLLIYGCSSPMQTNFKPQTYQTKTWDQRKSKLTQKKRWYMQGAVSFTIKDKTQIGTFTWQQQRDQYRIQIAGPLNLAGATIQGGANNVALWKGGQWHYSSTAENLMKQQLGWYLPVSNLYYWVRGIPAPGVPAEEKHDQFGHLTSLQQQGWSIVYKAYETRNNVDLPRTIYLNNQGLHAKMVIKDWQMG